MKFHTGKIISSRLKSNQFQVMTCKQQINYGELTQQVLVKTKFCISPVLWNTENLLGIAHGIVCSYSFFRFIRPQFWACVQSYTLTAVAGELKFFLAVICTVHYSFNLATPWSIVFHCPTKIDSLPPAICYLFVSLSNFGILNRPTFFQRKIPSVDWKACTLSLSVNSPSHPCCKNE